MRCALPEERANLAAYAELTVRKPHLPGKDEIIPNESGCASHYHVSAFVATYGLKLDSLNCALDSHHRLDI